MTSFEVVAMVVGSQAIVDGFISHYIRIGAKRVSIYYDGTAEVTTTQEGAEILFCDEEFWRRHGVSRPPIVEDRQRKIYDVAYRSATYEWMLVVDSDEYLFSEMPIEHLLSAMPSDILNLRMLPAEAIFTKEDNVESNFSQSCFRLPMSRVAAQILPRLIYGGIGGIFSFGLLGHSFGKHFVRTGRQNVMVDIHKTRTTAGAHEDVYTYIAKPSEMLLAHFDAIGFEPWLRKWELRNKNNDSSEMGSKRLKQMKLFLAAETLDRKRQLFKRFYALGMVQEFALKKLGYLKYMNVVVN